MPTLFLKSGREKPILRRHPWIFSGSVVDVHGEPSLGETVDVRNSKGDFLAWAAYSPHSQIRARVWSWDEADVIDAEFFRRRLTKSISARAKIILNQSSSGQDATRLVYGESDGLPGLVVDRYGDTIVVQFLAAGVEYWRDTIVDLILELVDTSRIYERSDVDVRILEGLALRNGLLRGSELEDNILIHENGLKLWVDVKNGHKTGFYLDQRLNHLQVGALAADRQVLDCFAYTGGFTVSMLASGAASVVAVDTSVNALALARENVKVNNLPSDRIEWIEGDVFQKLRYFRDIGRQFDMIVLDPPKFAQTASQVAQAARGYKDINLLAFKLLRSNGLLVTFSCSGGVNEDLFQKIVAGAALDADVEAQIIKRLHQGPDHPVALNYPEGAYLKGFIIRVL
jgi:23S rRNA (cytosine1962-C5)-methyltransferase